MKVTAPILASATRLHPYRSFARLRSERDTSLSKVAPGETSSFDYVIFD